MLFLLSSKSMWWKLWYECKFTQQEKGSKGSIHHPDHSSLLIYTWRTKDKTSHLQHNKINTDYLSSVYYLYHAKNMSINDF